MNNSFSFVVALSVVVLIDNETLVNLLSKLCATYRCFGCGSYALVGRSSIWTCRKCDTLNEYDAKDGIFIPASHRCANPVFCTFCVENGGLAQSYIRRKSQTNASFEFCDKCTHNQRIVLSLMASDPPDGVLQGNYRKRVLSRHPIACQHCEKIAKDRIDEINMTFKRSQFNARLQGSKSKLHEHKEKGSVYTSIRGLTQHFEQSLCFVSDYVEPVIHIAGISFHGMHLILSLNLSSTYLCQYDWYFTLASVKSLVDILNFSETGVGRIICLVFNFLKSWIVIVSLRTLNNPSQKCIYHGFVMMALFWEWRERENYDIDCNEEELQDDQSIDQSLENLLQNSLRTHEKFQSPSLVPDIAQIICVLSVYMTGYLYSIRVFHFNRLFKSWDSYCLHGHGH